MDNKEIGVPYMLHWCNKCNDYGVTTKINKDKGYRLDYCINKGCGYRATTPYPLLIHNKQGIIEVNIKRIALVDEPVIQHTELECGMTDDEADKYCQYINPDCSKGYCIRKDGYEYTE